MIQDFFNYQFLQNAFFASLLASLACGIIGVIIVEKKLVMMSGGISHTSFGGIGLGYLLGIEPLIGGLIFSILAALGVIHIKKQTKTSEDTLLGMMWAAGMALGIVFISIRSGYPPDMTSYLFGDILTVSKTDLWFMLALNLVLVAGIFLYFEYWKTYLFDEELLQVLGFNIDKFEVILYLLIAISIVVLIKAVGIILVIAMLTIPASIGKMFVTDLKKLIIFACILGLVHFLVGLVISYYVNISSGATIILVSTVSYGLFTNIKKYLYKV
jgi:zinc transport system permease protein